MSLLDRVNARAAAPAGRKAFVQAPVWQTDALRWATGDAGSTSVSGTTESLDVDYEAYVDQALKANPIVFAAVQRRAQVFSQAAFKYQRQVNGRPGPMFGDPSLSVLERPWPNGTTGELLTLMEYDASAAGNSFWTNVDDRRRYGAAARDADGRRLVRMRPDWVTIVIGVPGLDPDDPDNDPFGLAARVLAYAYLPRRRGGMAVERKPVILLPEEVCHYSPIPDPTARFRGMSWLTPVIRDVQGDQAATEHKANFFRNGATPKMVVRFDKDMAPELFGEFVQKFNDSQRGATNAYRTLFLAGGADVTPLTMDLRALDYKAVQGAGETRIASVAGVPAVILQISEGLSGSSLNEGNFKAAKKLFVGTTIQDLWNKAAPSLRNLVAGPTGAGLVADARDIPFLHEDAADAASVQTQRAQTIRTLTDAGWTPESAIDAVTTDDFSRLVHSGLYSVQLQAPGSNQAPPAPAIEGN